MAVEFPTAPSTPASTPPTPLTSPTPTVSTAPLSPILLSILRAVVLAPSLAVTESYIEYNVSKISSLPPRAKYVNTIQWIRDKDSLEGKQTPLIAAISTPAAAPATVFTGETGGRRRYLLLLLLGSGSASNHLSGNGWRRGIGVFDVIPCNKIVRNRYIYKAGYVFEKEKQRESPCYNHQEERAKVAEESERGKPYRTYPVGRMDSVKNRSKQSQR